MYQLNYKASSGKSTYELLSKVLNTPMSGISPEKKLVDKFLRHGRRVSTN